MISHFTGLVVAGVVVGSMLGLITLAQEQPIDGPQSPSVRDVSQNRTAHLPPAEVLKMATDPMAAERMDAILQLGDTPGDLQLSVPRLAELTMNDDEMIRLAAELALEKIGIEGAATLGLLIDSDDPKQVSAACASLKQTGGAAMFFLPQVKQMLSSGDNLQRKQALIALQGGGPDKQATMDELLECLDDDDFNIQCLACQVLETLGPDAIPAEDRLLRLLQEGNPSSRSWAAIALGAIGPTDKTDIAKLLAANLKSPIHVEKERTLKGLANLGVEASSAAGSVRGLMEDHSKNVMPQAAFTYWKITDNPELPLLALGSLIASQTYGDDAIELAGKMQAVAAPLAEAIAARLADPEDATREIAVVALGNIGPSAAKHIPAIEKLLNDDDALIRYAAREALQQIR